MDSVDIEVLRTAEGWRRSGHKAALGTIVKTWGSAPRPVGAMVAIRDDGQIVGSVSGGCVEDDLVDKVKERLAAAKKPELLTYGVTNEEATRWGLPCGGTLQLVVEPITEKSGIQEAPAKNESQQLVKRRVEMDSGRATLEPGRWQDVLEFDGRVLSAVHGPRWRLVLIGAGQLTRYLAEMARMLDYHVVVIDPARGICRRLGPRCGAARPGHARRRGARDEPRRAQRDRRADLTIRSSTTWR
jgi:xanthine dehydrogenase accessory factor